ncbi:transposase, partial [Microcystis aeruginosa]|uniref:transposase n=1 Tax=Microcystis aeruginosa TaxID=1126 RepID=UPI0011B75CAF
LGQYRSNPCHSTVRLVSVLWGNTWYDYLTNVLDSEQLSAEEVCDLYRRRWQIEEAFLGSKSVLSEHKYYSIAKDCYLGKHSG